MEQGGEFLIRKQAVFIGDCSTQLFIYYTQGFCAQGYNLSVEEALFSKESVYDTGTTYQRRSHPSQRPYTLCWKERVVFLWLLTFWTWITFPKENVLPLLPLNKEVWYLLLFLPNAWRYSIMPITENVQMKFQNDEVALEDKEKKSAFCSFQNYIY